MNNNMNEENKSIENLDEDRETRDYTSVSQALIGNTNSKKYNAEFHCKRAKVYLFKNRKDKTFKGLAEHFNVSTKTIYNWIQKYKEFADAVIGIAQDLDHDVLSAIITAGTGYYDAKGNWHINEKMAFALARHCELGLEEDLDNKVTVTFNSDILNDE